MRIFISYVIYMIVVVRLFFGVFGCYNQRNFKQLIAYSSVYHIGWIILCNFSDDLSWFVYLLLYSLIIFPVMKFFRFLLFEDFTMLIKIKYKGWLILMVLRIAGIPPLLGFFLKLFAFIMIFKYEYYFIMFLIFCSVVMFYVYFRMIYDVLMRYYDNMNWINFTIMYNKNNYLIIINIVGLIMGVFLVVFFVI